MHSHSATRIENDRTFEKMPLFFRLLVSLAILSSGSPFLLKKKCKPYYDVVVHTVYETAYDRRCVVHQVRRCHTHYEDAHDTRFALYKRV